jgi:hypothetical protein
MTDQHLITPPPELVQQWADMLACRSDQAVFTRAAQWGADQELEACCDWLERNYNYPRADHPLRAARRPKPLSLRKQAYDALDTYIYGEPDPNDKERTYNTIRQALEALPQ